MNDELKKQIMVSIVALLLVNLIFLGGFKLFIESTDTNPTLDKTIEPKISWNKTIEDTGIDNLYSSIDLENGDIYLVGSAKFQIGLQTSKMVKIDKSGNNLVDFDLTSFNAPIIVKIINTQDNNLLLLISLTVLTQT